METMTNGTKFMAAFNDVEHHLRKVVGNGEYERFSNLRRMARDAKITTAKQDEQLGAFGNLRNAISHGRYEQGRPMADPVDSVAKDMEALREAIIQPPTVGDVICGRQAVEFSIDEPLSTALRYVLEHSYSQFPIRDQGQFVVLLTTNAIARWLAHQMDLHGGMAESEAVGEVLRHVEADEQAVLLARDSRLVEALERLSPPDPSVPGCTAVVVTHNGRPTDKTLGLITHADILDCAAGPELN
jgi:predicted transcriptional regulator